MASHRLRYSVLLFFFVFCYFLTKAIRAEDGSHTTALFAGGCFWCMQESFDGVEGVIRTTVGYSGGDVANPSYGMVSSGKTDHLEVLLIVFNPSVTDFTALLEVFWRNVDPVDGGGQFCDRGNQYRSAIFYEDDAQETASRKSIDKLENLHFSDSKVATLLLPRGRFYFAEDYHQSYYKKNPYKYKYYKYRCGRDKRLEELGLSK